MKNVSLGQKVSSKSFGRGISYVQKYKWQVVYLFPSPREKILYHINKHKDTVSIIPSSQKTGKQLLVNIHKPSVIFRVCGYQGYNSTGSAAFH